MATEPTEIEPEVKPEEPVVTPEDTATPEDPDSSQDPEPTEPEGDEPEGDEGEPEPTPAPKVEVVEPGLAVIPGETPRERALRIEITRLKRNANINRTKEITEPPKTPVPETKTESEILKKYKPEEIQSLREVLPELAKELGYVRKDELNASNYETTAQAEIDSFVAAHPEYSVEKDPDSMLWNRLKEEYQTVYKPPQNPKDFRKIFERIHKDIFGIQAAGPLPKVSAAQEKVKVASHAGASGSTAPRGVAKRGTSDLRFDALKGFNDSELADLQARAEE